MEKFYITTPIYYVNDKPHIGHSYTTVLADVLARYNRLAGKDVFFLTGTDEHGQKVAQSAEKSGITPKEHCDIYAKRFKDMWDALNLKYDKFIRTTDPEHIGVVQKALQKLFDNGDIYKDNYVGWYCVPDERFWTEKDLINGKCPECERPVTKIEEENYFFRMSKYQDWLIEYIQSNPEFIQPDFRQNEVLGFLRKPLNDLCISRPKQRLSWGVELPFDTEYVTYVWVDALINYISAVGLYFDQEKFNRWWPADIHLIGKDILTTHAVYWPILLKALGIQMPRTIFAHGWWMVDERKMGKSLGNAIDPESLVKTIGEDRLRYYLIRDMVLGQDASYSLSGLVSRLNNDLSNDLGNMLARVTNMVSAYFDCKLPQPAQQLDTETLKLHQVMDKLHKEVWENVESMKLHDALEVLNSAIRAANKYIEETQPWQLAKEGDSDMLATVLFTATQLLAKVGILLFPVIPQKSQELLTALDYQGEMSLSACAKDTLVPPGANITKPPSLFPRLHLNDLRKKLGVIIKPEEQKQERFAEGLITIEQLSKVKLKVGRIISAKKAANADKLLLLEVDLGKERRNLVAGIAQWYNPDELAGKNIVVVTNLEPATIRGHKSQGMLLAADDGNSVSLLTVDKNVEPGSEVK
ncbi:methionine--tRNA ligase [bacterium]|nr:MAG: methionine--tRNA ligase [bacterium]